MNPGQKSAVKNHLDLGINPYKKQCTKKELCESIGTTISQYDKYQNEEYIKKEFKKGRPKSDLTKKTV